MKIRIATLVAFVAMCAVHLHASAITITSNNATYSYNIPQTPGGTVTASVSGSVNFGPGDSSITMNIWLIAYGTGSYSLHYTGTGDSDGDRASFGDDYLIDTATTDASCFGSCSTQGILVVPYNTPFELTLDGFVHAYSSGNSGSYYANLSVFGQDTTLQQGVALLPYDPAAVPEPSTFALAGVAGLAGLAFLRRRRTN